MGHSRGCKWGPGCDKGDSCTQTPGCATYWDLPRSRTDPVPCLDNLGLLSGGWRGRHHVTSREWGTHPPILLYPRFMPPLLNARKGDLSPRSNFQILLKLEPTKEDVCIDWFTSNSTRVVGSPFPTTHTRAQTHTHTHTTQGTAPAPHCSSFAFLTTGTTATSTT